MCVGPVRIPIGSCAGSLGARRQRSGAFTLLELLVVIAIISTLTAILIPVTGRVRRQARAIVGMGNLRQIAAAANCFALDNDDTYPPSVATVGFGDNWNWQEPMMLTSYRKRSPQVHRSMSAYMRHYIENASVMFCPNAPEEYRYLQEAWDAGDDWIHPETGPVPDPVIGVYCFYWNYTGHLGQERGLFRGPTRPAGGYGQSKLLVSDYFGYDHWRSRYAYGSCEKLNGADVTEGTLLSSDYWSRQAVGGQAWRDNLGIELHAAYTDGHVGGYSASETFRMRVIQKRETNEPYDAGAGPGDFYLPRNSLAPGRTSRR